MVFSLISFIEDWLAKNYKNSKKSVRLPVAEVEDENSSKPSTIIEEKVLDEGTPVTKETFLAWKERFLKENLGNLKGPAAQLAPVQKESKFTGKQLFEQNKSLAASDAAFADDGIAIESNFVCVLNGGFHVSFLVDESAFEGITFDEEDEEEEVAYDNRGQISGDDDE